MTRRKSRVDDALEVVAPQPEALKDDAPKRSEPGVARCVRAFHDAFVAKFGCKPIIRGGEDGKHFKEMIATWGEATVLELMRTFFTTTDPRVVRRDYYVRDFYAVAQHLRLRDMKVGTDDRMASNIDAVTRAIQRRVEE